MNFWPVFVNRSGKPYRRGVPLQIGIVGLPNVGKSTLFNALIRSRSAQAANYPFCTIEPNVGVVEVPDERLTKLAEFVKPEKVIPAAIEFVDIAGLVAGASKGEGLGNKFLSHIREVHAICEVVRLFPEGDIIHVAGSIDGKRDIAMVETELVLADLESLERRWNKVVGGAKSGIKEALRRGSGQAPVEAKVLEKIREALNAGKLASTVSFSDEQEVLVRSFQLLTRKPLLYAVNVSEEQLGKISLEQAKQGLGLGMGSGMIVVSAKIEEELLDLDPAEAKEYLSGLGVKSSGLDQLVQAAYSLLGLHTFFTAGPKEVRAWTMKKGGTAPEAAGVIHTDFQKGFICAETIAYGDYIAAGSEHAAKEKGKMRTEGKGYSVRDGDIFHFRFNV